MRYFIPWLYSIFVGLVKIIIIVTFGLLLCNLPNCELKTRSSIILLYSSKIVIFISSSCILFVMQDYKWATFRTHWQVICISPFAPKSVHFIWPNLETRSLDPLIGLKCSFAYSHRNVFGRNKKLNLSLERGQIDSIFRINYTDPWIDGDNKRTSRTMMVQVSKLLYLCSFLF